MSELSTLLLLACTTCLNGPDIAQAQLPTAVCDSPQQSAECSSATPTAIIAQAPPSPAAQTASPIGPYSQGKRVIELQKQLNQLGYYTGDLDGIYGRLTRSAVTQFQQDNGLRTDGIVGAETQAALAKPSTTTSAPDPASALAEPPTEATTRPSFDSEPFVSPEIVISPPVVTTPANPPSDAPSNVPKATPPVVEPEGAQTLWSSSTAAIQTALGSPSTPIKKAFAVMAGLSLLAGWGVVIRREAKRNALSEENLGLSSDIELLLADLPTSEEPVVEQTASKPTKLTARRAKTLVATLVSNDCTPESAYEYQLVDDADGSFVLINRELWLTHHRPDQENFNRYTVVIRCTDRRGVSIDQPFRIRVMPSLAMPRPVANGATAPQASRVKALSSRG
ncbi:MAG: peptidoglycan-binding protein [Cyanobacteria bacterium P01_G01_bin.38]